MLGGGAGTVASLGEQGPPTKARWRNVSAWAQCGCRRARWARAHDIVYEAAQGAVTQGRPFHALLAEDRHIMAHLTPQQITDLLDPAH